MSAKDPSFAIKTSVEKPWAVLKHARHKDLTASYRIYSAENIPEDGRVSDLLAWGTTVLCDECGPICPLCGRPAKHTVLDAGIVVRAGWVHA